MPLPLYLEWVAYSRLNPFGERRADLRAAQVAAAVFNARRTKQSQPVVKLEDMLLRFGASAADSWQPMSERDAYQQLKMFLALGPGLVDLRKRDVEA